MQAAVSANAAIYLDPEAYLTSNAILMDRHSGGESSSRGFLRHDQALRERYGTLSPPGKY